MITDNEAFRIRKPKTILVEGKDDLNFFEKLLSEKNIQDIQVIEIGGKDKIHSSFPDKFLKAIHFDTIVSYAIIQDADNNTTSTFESIRNLLVRTKQIDAGVLNNCGTFTQNRDNKRIGVWIFDNGNNSGMLEDLFIKMFEDKPFMSCVNQFVECLQNSLPARPQQEPLPPGCYRPKNMSKSKTQAILASMHKEYQSVGRAAQDGQCDFNIAALQPLIDFIRQM